MEIAINLPDDRANKTKSLKEQENDMIEVKVEGTVVDRTRS